MKLSISNIAWNINDNNKVYKLMNLYGFTGIEIAPTKVFSNIEKKNQKELNAFKKEINEHGIKCIAMQSLLFGKNDLELFSSSNEKLLNYLENIIEIGSKLGSKSLIFGSPKNRIYKGISKEKAIEKSIIFFRKLGDLAYKKGVFICIEANPKIYGGNFMCNTKETLNLVKTINNKGIKLHLDLGTIIVNNEDLSIITEGLPYVTHFHISEPYLDIITDREEHNNVVKLLKDYDGYCSIEMKESSIENIESTLKLISNIYN